MLRQFTCILAFEFAFAIRVSLLLCYQLEQYFTLLCHCLFIFYFSFFFSLAQVHLFIPRSQKSLFHSFTCDRWNNTTKVTCYLNRVQTRATFVSSLSTCCTLDPPHNSNISICPAPFFNSRLCRALSFPFMPLFMQQSTFLCVSPKKKAHKSPHCNTVRHVLLDWEPNLGKRNVNLYFVPRDFRWPSDRSQSEWKTFLFSMHLLTLCCSCYTWLSETMHFHQLLLVIK